jgi:hypothetical protein
MIMDFIRCQQQQGRAVESVCRVLSEQGLQVAARTYRAWQARRTLGPRLLALAYRPGPFEEWQRARPSFHTQQGVQGHSWCQWPSGGLR